MKTNYNVNEIKDYIVLQNGVLNCRTICMEALTILLMNRVSYDAEVIDSNTGAKTKKRVTAHRVDAAPLFINKVDEISRIIGKNFKSAVDNKTYTAYEYVNSIDSRSSLYTPAYIALIKDVLLYYTTMSHYLKIIYSLNKSDLETNRMVLTESSIMLVEDKVKVILNSIKSVTESVWNSFAVGYTETLNNLSGSDSAKDIEEINNWISAKYDIMEEIMKSNDFEIMHEE